MHTYRLLAIGLLYLCAGAHAALVEPVPKLNNISPDSVQRGTTGEVTIAGDNFDEASRVVLTPDTGVKVEVEKAPKGGRALKVKFTVAADAPLNDRELRVLTAGGATNPMLLNIGRFPVVPQKSPINKFELAQPVQWPAALIGNIGGNGDVDYYKFAARKGDFLVFDVYANRRGSTLDASLRLLTAAGRELARDEDTFGLDPIIRHHFQEDGEYLLEIKDVRMNGGAAYRYRIEGGAIPYIESIFPLGGQRGQTVQVTLNGYNLGDQAKQTIQLAADAPLSPRYLAATTPLGISNSAVLQVSDAPEAAEAEPNNTWQQATVIAVPGGVSGVIHERKEIDRFKFKASAQRVIIEVTAARINSPLDVLLTLSDVNGNTIAIDDDAAAGADARIDAKGLQKDAEYIVSVRDLHDRGSPHAVYHLSIAPPKAPGPDFSVRFIPDVPRVTRGGNAKIWCEVKRDNGFAGDVTVKFEGLPKGVTCEPFVVSNSLPSSGIFTIGAAAAADLGAFPVTLVATGPHGEQAITRNGTPEMAPARQAWIAVVDNPPFTLELVENDADDTQKLDAEAAELQKQLDNPGPDVAAAQTAWEQSDAVKSSWTVLDPTSMISSAYASLTKQPDGSILAGGTNPARDMYKLIVKTSLKGITAFRLEALADPSLGGGGPGRAENGNFVLNYFKVDAAPTANENSITAVKFKKVTADFSQDGWPVEEALLNTPNEGWAVAPQMGKSHTAVFECAEPVGTDGGTTLTITLDHNSPHNQHIIGKFRLSVTQGTAMSMGAVLPYEVRAALDLPADKRNDVQKKALATYYQSIDPTLQKLRGRLLELKAVKSSKYPPNLSKKNGTDLLVLVRRRPDFKGDVTLSLEGFAVGRDPQNGNQPAQIAKDLEIKPVVVKGSEIAGVLQLKAKNETQEGTRTAVVKGEVADGGQVFVQYSKAVPVTVDSGGPAAAKKFSGKELKASNVKYPLAGLQVKSFEGDWDNVPDFGKLKPAKQGIAKVVDTTPRTRDEQFGLQFTGYVEVKKDGEYTFHLGSDDGSLLFFGEELAISNDGLHALEFQSVKVKMKAGMHAIRVDFFEKSGGEGLELHYEGPDLPKQPIPATAFFHTKVKQNN